jgi:hypothetical protein
MTARLNGHATMDANVVIVFDGTKNIAPFLPRKTGQNSHDCGIGFLLLLVHAGT